MSDSYPYDICIIGGLGHIGLPLGIAFAESGLRVVLYDNNIEHLKSVKKGRIPFYERGAEEALRRVLDKTLEVSDKKKVIAKSRFIIVVIGTPIDEHLSPKFSPFLKLFDEIENYLGDDQHLILRSTLFPGATQKIKTYLESKQKNTKLSFCPERISEGYAMEELRSLPQIISSFDKDSLEEVRQLFLHLTQDIIVLEPLEAEIAKLFTNSWRYMHFAISNQFYEMATEHHVDFYKIYDAMLYKYPRTKNFPRPGFAAGPCLYKDTMQLASYSNDSFFLGHAAMLINEGMPNFLVGQLKQKCDLKTKKVGILGMAFKADCDDKRDSLSYKLKKILIDQARTVFCSDAYIQEDGFVDADTLIANSDIIILGTPHQEYTKLIIPEEKTLVDIWNFFNRGGLF